MSEALRELAAQLRAEETSISPYLTESPPPGDFDLPGEYELVVEAVREGYLLHYGEPRLLSGHDEDLALLAGDYLYALGIERLAALGDPDSVLLLADLISSCAQLHAEGRTAEVPDLWERAIASLHRAAEGLSR